MTDRSGARARSRLPRPQPWQAILAAGLSVLTAATVTVVLHTTDPASADTWITSSRNAVLRLADGHESTATAGQLVPRGAQVRTGQDGGAELSTAGRNVYIGALSTLDVIDGVRERLTRGQVMADSRRGPRLQLRTLAGTVASSAGALTRVETGAVLRLGVFEGLAAITASGRQASTPVTALHQVQVPYGFLPGAVTPLALRDDRWEAHLASNLVTADHDLTHLAANLDGADGVALLKAAPVTLRTSVTSTSRGEQALSVAVAQAARTGSSPQENLTAVQGYRSDGGSWGVVAALVNARVTAVSALLDEALAPPGGNVPTVLAEPPLTNLPGLLNPSTSPTQGHSTGPTTSASPTPRRTPTTPSPTPPTPVDDLVTTVLGLVPTPTPVAVPVATPTPTPTPSSLLGGLLDVGKLLH